MGFVAEVVMSAEVGVMGGLGVPDGRAVVLAQQATVPAESVHQR